MSSKKWLLQHRLFLQHCKDTTNLLGHDTTEGRHLVELYLWSSASIILCLCFASSSLESNTILLEKQVLSAVKACLAHGSMSSVKAGLRPGKLASLITRLRQNGMRVLPSDTDQQRPPLVLLVTAALLLVLGPVL